jgi:phage terminase large subunit
MNQLEKVVRIKKTPVFDANKEAYQTGKYRRIINQGSTRSSKTYSIVQLCVEIADTTKKQISITSPSMPHLKRGARKDFLDIMDRRGDFKEDNFNRTDNIYRFDSGGYIEFFGCNESDKVHGPGRDILFINEANLVDESVYRQLAIRTKETVFLDFNPADEYSYVYNLIDLDGSRFIHSTYKNNKGNLTKEIIDEIESLQYADENLWKVYGLGLRGTSSETIYTHWKTVKALPGKGETFYGQDFGYNVPSALVKVEIYEGGVYCDEMLYEPKLTTNDLVEKYKTLIGSGSRVEIFCDAAEPKTIEELIRAKYNAKPADKDVTEGIRKVKGMPLYITERSTNLIKEIKSYKWKVDKDNRVLDEPVKFMDHGMDALRYAVFTKLQINKRTWAIV